MNIALAFFLLGLSVLVLSISANAEPQTATKQERAFDSKITRLENQLAQQSFAPVQLDFAVWLSQQKNGERAFSLVGSSVNLAPFNSLRKAATKLQPITPCQQIRMDNLMLQLTLMQTRQKLLHRLPLSTRYSGSFSNFPDGKDWYRHWLNAWLLLDGEQGVTDAHVAQLKEVAEQELRAVYPEYLTSTKAKKNQNTVAYSKTQQPLIVAELRAREQTVLTHLHNLFADLPYFPQVNIQPSSLPKSFPAPGIYDSQNSVFYYHFYQDTLPEESLDWLYLHEAVPGHHMQMSLVNEPSFSNDESLCPASQFVTDPMVSIEGWGAWVETLGQDLGLYAQPASLAYALQWRVLRALRVLMDIGIHYEGWADSKAMALWLTYFPHKVLPVTEELGKREIARIHRWPVQVITYVYGKHLIEAAVADLKSDAPQIDNKHIHSALLRLSNQPPHALKWLPDLLKQQNKLKKG